MDFIIVVNKNTSHTKHLSLETIYHPFCLNKLTFLTEQLWIQFKIKHSVNSALKGRFIYKKTINRTVRRQEYFTHTQRVKKIILSVKTEVTERLWVQLK